jgi:hypothetical protein
LHRFQQLQIRDVGAEEVDDLGDVAVSSAARSAVPAA